MDNSTTAASHGTSAPSTAKRKKARNSSAREKAAPTSLRRAVVVGINDYGGINDLPSCVNDARAMQELLSAQYKFDDVAVLLDGQATRKNFVAAVARAVTGAPENGRVVIYFSGHGSTDRRASGIEECLVLHDGFLFDDEFVGLFKEAPPGAITVILDSCFSGGMEKQLLKAAFRPGDGVERTRVKAYVRIDAKEFAEHTSEQEAMTTVRRFGAGHFQPHVAFANRLLSGPEFAKALVPAPASDEVGPSTLNGLLLSACLETETAAASTSYTEGKSAFTFALLESLKRLGYSVSSNYLTETVQKRLKGIGFAQTPLIKEPKTAQGLGRKSFIVFEEPKEVTATVTHGNSADSAMSTLINIISRVNSGERAMDPATIIQIISALTKSQQPQNKGFGDLASVLIPLIIKSANGASSQSKGLVDVLPIILPLLKADGQAAPENKGLMDLLPVILPAVMKSNGVQSKLFGIDDAILIPAIVNVIAAAASKNSGAQSKLFGIDDAIIIPALAGVISSAINR